MNLVPGIILDIYEDKFSANQDLIRKCGRQVGNKVEIDLELLPEDLANELEDIWLENTRLWDELDTGSVGESLLIEYPIYFAEQKNTKTLKKDLTQELQALSALDIGPLIEEISGKDIDLNKIQSYVELLDGEFSQEGNWSTLEFTLDTFEDWPAELGGFPSRAEVGRVFKLVFNHAAWRDRRNRRLVEVSIRARERWARI